LVKAVAPHLIAATVRVSPIFGILEIFAEDPTDYLGYAESAGDINLDGVPGHRLRRTAE
jgi:hypothetical protein